LFSLLIGLADTLMHLDSLCYCVRYCTVPTLQPLIGGRDLIDINIRPYWRNISPLYRDVKTVLSSKHYTV